MHCSMLLRVRRFRCTVLATNRARASLRAAAFPGAASRLTGIDFFHHTMTRNRHVANATNPSTSRNKAGLSISIFSKSRLAHNVLYISSISERRRTMIQLTEAAAGALHSAIATVPTSIAGLRLVVRSRRLCGISIRDGAGGRRVKPEDISCESRGVKNTCLIHPRLH